MSEQSLQRVGVVSGVLAFVTGIVGLALERGWPSSDDPSAVSAFVQSHSLAVFGQSAGFIVSSALYIVFLASLRGLLARASKGSSWLADAAFGAGLVWIALSMVAQAFQIGIATAILHGTEVPQGLLWTGVAAFGTANLPAGVMLSAVGASILIDRAFPAWLGLISLLAALAQVLLWAGTFVSSGPLSATGWMTYVLYPLFLVWLLPTLVLMLIRRAE